MQDPEVSFHCLPSDPARRATWIDAFGLKRGNSRPSHECAARGNFQAPTEQPPLQCWYSMGFT